MPKYIFALSRDYTTDSNVVYVTDKDDFENSGFVTEDLDDEVCEIMDIAGFVQEGPYWVPLDPDYTTSGITMALEAEGLEHSELFQEYIDESSTEF